MLLGELSGGEETAAVEPQPGANWRWPTAVSRAAARRDVNRVKDQSPWRCCDSLLGNDLRHKTFGKLIANLVVVILVTGRG